MAIARELPSPQLPHDTPPADKTTSNRIATIGKGGRDIVPRFRFEQDGSYRPFLALELYGSAGEDLSLLGPDATHFRSQPVMLVGFHPSADASIYAGGGPGASLVTLDPLRDPDHTTELALTAAALVGTRWTSGAYPMLIEARADAVSAGAFAASVHFIVELAE